MSAIAMPPPLCVTWSCRRCGHTGGIARCTVPVQGWDEQMVRHLLDSLRQKLIRKHAAQGCIATAEDFAIDRTTDRTQPDGKTVVGIV